jgi:hypothetical protein
MSFVIAAKHNLFIFVWHRINEYIAIPLYYVICTIIFKKYRFDNECKLF